ncbi:MAG: hypothetical protein ABIJ28_03600 [Patescibacteria group bacterium]
MPDIIKNIKNETETEISSLEWQAPEYNFNHKTTDWFWSLGIICIAGIVAAFLFKNFLLAVIIILGGFSLSLYGAKKPRIVSFGINSQGVKIENKIYYYEDLKKFWINYDPPHKKELLLESKKTFMPHTTVMLGDTDPVKVRAILKKFLPEQQIEESMSTIISKFFGF